jgi:hypothetical protein
MTIPDELGKTAALVGVMESKLQPGNGKRPKPRVLSVADIRALPPVSYVIEPWAPAGTVVVLSAYTGAGKSVVSSALAIAAMSGLPFLGKYSVHQAGPVLLFDEETPASYLQSRIASMGFRDEDPLHVVHFSGLKLDEDADFNCMVELVEELHPVLILFDTLIRFHSCDENSASEMRFVMERLRHLANMGPCVWTQIHQNKGIGDLRKRSRGSSDIIGGCDLELSLTEDEQGVLCLQSVKARMAPIAAEHLQIKNDDWGGELQVVLSDEWGTEIQQAVEELLAETDTGLSISKLWALLKEQGHEVGRNTVDRVVKAMDGQLTYTEGPRNVRLYRRVDT